MVSCQLALLLLVCTVVAVQSQSRQFPSSRFTSRRTSSSVSSKNSPQGRASVSRASTSRGSSRRLNSGLAQTTSQLSSSAGGSSFGRPATSRASSSSSSFSSRRKTSRPASKPASSFSRTKTTSSTSPSRAPSSSSSFSSRRKTSRPASKPASSFSRTKTTSSTSPSRASSSSSSFSSRRKTSRPASKPASSFSRTKTTSSTSPSRTSSSSSSFSSRRKTSRPASKPASSFSRTKTTKSTTTSSGNRPSSSPFNRQRASTSSSSSSSSSSAFGSNRRKTTTSTRQSSSRSPSLSGSSRRPFSSSNLGSNSRTRAQTRPLTGGSAFRSGAQKKKLLKQAPTVNFNCPEPDGFFADKGQCDKYFECNEGVAKEHTCPDGLLFHPERSYPCVYPVEANCEGRSAQQDPQATEECPRQYATFRTADDPSCGAFTRCINGRAYRSGCSEGLAFDARTLGCEYADEVDGCDAPERAKATAECPRQFGRYALPGAGCQQYKVCVKGEAWEMTCPGNLMWNQANHMCDYPDLVPEKCAEAYLGFECPPREFTADQVGEFTRERHPTNCTKYYVCVNKEDGSVQPRLQGCPEPAVFDPVKGECNTQPQEVAGCEDAIPEGVLAAYQQRDSDEQERRTSRLAELRSKLKG